MFSKILHANDGSEGALRALAVALDLAKRHRAELHMVCVEEIQWMPGSREEVIGEKELENRRFDSVMQRAAAEAQRKRLKVEAHLLVGHPVKAISEFINANGSNALVIGYVGHTQIFSMLIGGTAERQVRLAPCTVIVVK